MSGNRAKNRARNYSQLVLLALLGGACPSWVLAQGAPEPPKAQEAQVRIDRFEVQGNSLLSAAAMEQVLGQPPAQASLTQLQALAQRLQNAYREAGYGAVVVLLPEQSLQDRVLRLQVVEGKLSIVNVTGQSHFSRNNVLRSLPALRIGQTPSLADLDRELLLANDNPLKTSRVVLQPGTDPSEVEALITGHL